jgi:predicted secreted protein
MMKLFMLGALILGSTKVQAKNMIRIKALGSSPRGQFVAFEEFGYMNDSKTPFARIRVKNVWKDSYVNKPINVIADDENKRLDQVRAMAIDLAKKQLEKFNINT